MTWAFDDDLPKAIDEALFSPETSARVTSEARILFDRAGEAAARLARLPLDRLPEEPLLVHIISTLMAGTVLTLADTEERQATLFGLLFGLAAEAIAKAKAEAAEQPCTPGVDTPGYPGVHRGIKKPLSH